MTAKSIEQIIEPADRNIPEGKTSLGKALLLLDAFRELTPPVGVSDLAKRVGLPKSTAFRLLRDLASAGFVEREGRDYRLGLPLFELGNRVAPCRPNGLRDAAMHHLGELHASTGRSVQIAVLDGVETVNIAKVSRQIATRRHHMQPGTRMPASCSSMGKAIVAFSLSDTVRAVIDAGLPIRTRYSISTVPRFLSELAQVRERGIAFDREELALGVVGVAAPVMFNGLAIAAVSVSMPAPTSEEARVGAQVREAALRISKDYARMHSEIW